MPKSVALPEERPAEPFRGSSTLLSGFIFTFRGMPAWAQGIGSLLLLTHFLRGVRGILLKGNALNEIWHDLWPILIFVTIAIDGLCVIDNIEQGVVRIVPTDADACHDHLTSRGFYVVESEVLAVNLRIYAAPSPG